jgi:hypothetical protein
MRFLRRTAGYTPWDHKRNEDILTELLLSPGFANYDSQITFNQLKLHCRNFPKYTEEL